MSDSLKDKVTEIERQEIINALKKCKYVMGRVAKKARDNRKDERLQDLKNKE